MTKYQIGPKAFIKNDSPPVLLGGNFRNFWHVFCPWAKICHSRKLMSLLFWSTRKRHLHSLKTINLRCYLWLLQIPHFIFRCALLISTSLEKGPVVIRWSHLPSLIGRKLNSSVRIWAQGSDMVCKFGMDFITVASETLEGMFFFQDYSVNMTHRTIMIGTKVNNHLCDLFW